MNDKKLEQMLDEVVRELFENIENEIPLEDFQDAPDLTKKQAQDKENSIDGLLAIVDGNLKLTPPKAGGSWPKIKVGENVIVKVGNQKVEDTCVVTSVNDVEIKVFNEPPQSNFNLSLSEDLVELILETEFTSGKKYYLKDSAPNNPLLVKAVFDKETPPYPLEEYRIIEEIKNLGIDLTKVDVYYDKIKQAAKALKSAKTVIARGKKMEPAEDGWIEYLFRTEMRLIRDCEDADRIDPFDRGEFNSVEAGQTLAIYHPPKEGKPGMTVTGKDIFPPEPKRPEIKVGEGVELLDEGKTAVATTSGRPSLSKSNVIHVVPEVVINKDVDVSTGYINFKGDVKVFGDVKDGLVVKAGGHVYIHGNVFHGKVLGEKGVVIKKNLVSSYVLAGGRSAEYKKMLPHVKKIKEILNKTIKIYEQLNENPKFSNKDLKSKGVGLFLKQIFENKFPELEKNVKELERVLPKEYEGEEKNLRKVLELMKNRLVGYGPFRISSIEELEKIEKFLGQVLEILGESIEDTADVIVNVSQNSFIDATGKVKVTGSGAHYSNIFAGKSIELTGFCRGGKLYAREKIEAGELGSSTGASTTAEIENEGVIEVKTIYPDVTIRVGNFVQKNQQRLDRVFFTEEGQNLGDFKKGDSSC